MPTPSTRGPYAKSADIRHRIVEACVDALAETGFHGVTMKDVARRADLGYTTLLHHYSRKEDLLAAVLRLRADESTEYLHSAQALDPATHPLEALRGMLAVLVDNEQRPGIIELHVVLSAEATSPHHPAHSYYAEQSRALRDFYRLAFATLATQGRLHSPLDPETLATMTVSLVRGLQAQWLLDRETVSVPTVIRAFLSSLVPDLED
ncbi:TetR/AcrR family transcriptional regulator [Modestobacter sp. VKM Ac-2984]|uniref:TetR/AcrR family transcriptional regulator n=1 Tax=Modestobacter sp. VKM Ac-2984 TaxID=3004138 RepID=UPI0022AAF11C|nr:TetR/AcrR family transcriptional regulator [Modestobacter sp. VKM Ac-2984]MCZ2816342.1 TetR/AcrR family transcriptional regulator [Modestobacter sp. VKM Ac-2984]